MSSSRSTRRAAVGLRLRGQLAEQQQRRDAVLVPHVLGVDAVAERLLVAERQAVDPADPLEAGQRLDVRLAGGRGHACRAATTRRSRWRRCPACRACSRCVREQRADLVAAQHPPAVRAGHGGGAPVGVGVVGDHDVGAGPLGERHREVHRARLLGVGERDGREVRVGLLLLLDDLRARRSRRSRAPAPPTRRRRRAAACRRCRGRAGRRRRGRRRCRGSGRRCPRASTVPGVAARARRRAGPTAAIRRGDLGVGRRHDLAAVAEVDLVAVVLRRVVARGHHHAGDAAELADRERQQRRRQRPRQHVAR